MYHLANEKLYEHPQTLPVFDVANFLRKTRYTHATPCIVHTGHTNVAFDVERFTILRRQKSNLIASTGVTELSASDVRTDTGIIN